jgi:hypothetical protein
MKAIYVAALITTLVALAVYGAIICRMKSPADRLSLWSAFLITLPLQPLTFYLVRLPFNVWLIRKIGSTSLTYEWITLFYAPLTEEPAKLVPLLVPFILRDIRRENFVRYALAIGLGFGIGEMWFVAQRIAISPQFASIPFWQFTGFFNERLMVCLLHSAFVSVALWRLRDKFLLGEAGAMLLHFFGNFPIYLMSKNVFGIGKTGWSLIVSLWVGFYFFGGIALLTYFVYGKGGVGRFIFGQTKCPECRVVYNSPFLGLNLGTKRYERCSACVRWHMIGIENKVMEETGSDAV